MSQAYDVNLTQNLEVYIYTVQLYKLNISANRTYKIIISDVSAIYKKRYFY